VTGPGKCNINIKTKNAGWLWGNVMLSLRYLKRFALFLCLLSPLSGTSVAAELTRVKVASTTKEVFDNLALYVAANGGLFKAEGLEVEITHFAGGGDVVRAVASGAADIGMVATTAAIIAAGRGEPLKIISAWTAPAYGILFVVPPDSPIKSVKDLAGKKVGITRPGSVSHTGLNAALQANGILGQAEVVPVGAAGDGWTALKSGRVQATWHTAPDVYSLVDRGEARILFQISEYLKDYQQGSLAARDAYVQANGDTVRKFLRASVRAGEFIEKNPAEAAKMGAAGMGAAEQAMKQTIAAMPKGFFRIGAPQAKDFAGSVAEALESGGLKEAPSYDKVVDKNYLP
jgi:NitT/TauT family transport system substrate-binding protein